MPAPSYRGAYTALVTPFRNDRFDEAAFTKLLEEQIAAGIAGVIPVGTTGESAALDMAEHLRVIEFCVEVVKGRIPVFAGTGSNATAEAIYLTSEAEKRGADGFLVVTPYYNKPSQAGLIAHYAKIAGSTKLPVIAYSVPGRTGIEISVDAMVTLARQCPNINAIKEAGGSIERFSQLRQALPDSVAILSGDDSMTLPALAVGAVGVISVASNLVPREVVALVNAFLDGRTAEAEKLHRRLYPIFRDLFVEANPVPVKTAMAARGLDDRRRAPAARAAAGDEPREARGNAEGAWIMSGRTRVIIVGSKGRMGEALLRLGAADPALEIVGGVDRGDDLHTIVDRCDVLIEFAHHSATADLLELAVARSKSLVIGTTGHTAEEKAKIAAAAARLPSSSRRIIRWA